MSAYMIARVKVTNPGAYKEYTKHTPRIIAQFGGKIVVRGSEPTTLEGQEETHRIVVLEFPTKDQAEAFYYSEEYQDVKKLRAGAGEGQFILVDGYPEEQWLASLAESQKHALPQ